jgi:hypothetical protein
MVADGSSPGKGGGFENRLSKLIINADSGRNGQLFSSARFAEPVSVVVPSRQLLLPLREVLKM